MLIISLSTTFVKYSLSSIYRDVPGYQTYMLHLHTLAGNTAITIYDMFTMVYDYMKLVCIVDASIC